MIPAKEAISAVTVYGTAMADNLTQHGIAAAITSTQVSNFVFLGMTLGAWVTVLIFIGTLFIFIMNSYRFVKFIKNTFKTKDTQNEKCERDSDDSRDG